MAMEQLLGQMDLLGQITVGMLFWLIPLIIWEAVWKGIGLWKSARNNQLAWFIVIMIVNSVGILPIIYLLFFQNCCKKK